MIYETTTDRYHIQARWFSAVESYRRSVDLYRRVMELRQQRRDWGARPMPVELVQPPPPEQPLALYQLPPESRGTLTPREHEVALLIARGYTNKQIADTLVVTRGTVANHVAHILAKLDLSNRTQLASYVTRGWAAELGASAAAD